MTPSLTNAETAAREIPADVFATAMSIVRDELSGHSAAHKTAFGLANIISRAIMAAEKRGEERERSACAAVADEYVWDDHALAQATAIGKAVHHQSVEIAEAIRNRGEG